jgi:hypothetical protein
LIQRLGKHYHSDIAIFTIERQLVRENCKRKTVDYISTKPNKIIRTELLTDNYLTLYHKDFNTIRKTMINNKWYGNVARKLVLNRILFCVFLGSVVSSLLLLSVLNRSIIQLTCITFQVFRVNTTEEVPPPIRSHA